MRRRSTSTTLKPRIASSRAVCRPQSRAADRHVGLDLADSGGRSG